MIEDKKFKKSIEKWQVDEELGAIIYQYMAKREKDVNNQKVLEDMSKDEKEHAKLWKTITKKNLKPPYFTILFFKLVTIFLGFTFVVKIMQKSEKITGKEYEELEKYFPEVAKLTADERKHEKILYNLLDEEKLHYVGAVVLGLNDALVELTGALSGVTFALANNKLIAMTGIITGISATLSMSASNYLAEKTTGNKNALKSSLYTGVAYLVTVILMILPYLTLPSSQYLLAFIMMFVIVISIILFFNYYISVAKEEKFLKNFITMILISSSVAIISFLIAILAKQLLGIEAA